MTNLKKITITIILAAVTIISSSAQTVGVVLSGGGAKGLYHVGILKALEENNIPIDYISGASMGAVVGGMYAMGYSPSDMIRFFESDSVSNWLKGEIPSEYRYFFRKEGTIPEMISVSLNDLKTEERTGSPIKLPTSLLSSDILDIAFIEMMTGASCAAHENFDSLFVPFRCVATDTYNKQLVTFRDGSLPFAVRSSMAIPLVFKAMKKDSLLLYDGGMLNNFPWQSMEADFHPDIMIGGVCVGNNANPEEDDLIGQVMTIFTGQTDYSLPDNGKNLCIKRRFKDIGILDYSKAKIIIELGYKDAMEVMPQILKVVSRRTDSTEVTGRRAAFRRNIAPLIFDSVYIDGVTDAQKNYLYHQLCYLEQGSDYEMKYFAKKYTQVLGAGVFDGNFPRVTYNAERKRYQLYLTMKAKPQIKFSAGGNISSTSLSQLYLGFNYRHVTRLASSYSIGGILGSFYNTVSGGGRHDFYTNFPFYIQYNYSWEQYDYTTNHMRKYSKDNDFELGSNVSNSINLSFGASAFTNYIFKINWRGSIDEFLYYPGTHISSETMDNTNFKSSDLNASIQKYTFNYSRYPTQGMDFKIAFHYWAGIESYQKGNSVYSQTMEGADFKDRNRTWLEARVKFENYHYLGRWFNLGYLIDAKISNAPEFGTGLATYFMRTQFSPTPHSETMFMPEFRSASHLALGIVPIIKFTENQKFYLKAYAYGYMPQEGVYADGQVSISDIGKHLLGIFGGALVYQTPIGPASISYDKYTTGPNNWGIMLNIGVSIFDINRQ